MHVDEFDSIVRRAMSTLIKPMTYGYEGQDDGFAYTSLLLSQCQKLCLGYSVGDLVDGWPLPIFPKKKKNFDHFPGAYHKNNPRFVFPRIVYVYMYISKIK